MPRIVDGVDGDSDGPPARRGCWTRSSTGRTTSTYDGSIAHDESTYGPWKPDRRPGAPRRLRQAATHGQRRQFPSPSRASRWTAILRPHCGSVRERAAPPITPLTRSDPYQIPGVWTRRWRYVDAAVHDLGGERRGEAGRGCGPPGRVLRGSGLDSGWGLAPLSAVTRGDARAHTAVPQPGPLDNGQGDWIVSPVPWNVDSHSHPRYMRFDIDGANVSVYEGSDAMARCRDSQAPSLTIALPIASTPSTER